MSLVPGTILAGKYRVARVLGQGGMGMVVEAYHAQLHERVALKFLLPDFAEKPEFAERFLREARASVRIKSQHVARVSDVGTLENGSPFMVMEYLEGQDLAACLKQGPLQLPDAVDFVIQACEALAEAHQSGIIHRDIKPANLFLTRDSAGAPLVKVLDFGISKVVGNGEQDGLTRTTATMGSARYMSPEQMREARSVDHRADIYSLGITLYELLVGRQPFAATTLPELCALVLTGSPTPLRATRPDLTDAFAMLLEKSYAREREHRFQNIAELAFALSPYAPPRSQPIIDKIGKISASQTQTTDLPRASFPGAAPGSPQVTGPHQPYGTGPHQPYSTGPHQPHGTGPHITGPQSTGPHQLAQHSTGPGSKSAPMQTMAALTQEGGPTKTGRRGVWLPVALLAAALVGGAGAVMVLRGQLDRSTEKSAAAARDSSAASETPNAPTGPAPTAAQPPSSVASATAAPPPATPPPTLASAPASAAPSAMASVSAAPSSPPASTRPGRPTNTGGQPPPNVPAQPGVPDVGF